MRPRSIYRWKSFWFGVLVLAFLGWSWMQSMGEGGYIAINGHLDERVRLDQSGGRIAVVWMRENPVFSLPEVPLAKHSPEVDMRWFPRAFRYWSPIDGWNAVAIAHWFLILLFLVPWSVWLAWRWRMLRKAAAT
jgi:hypothetical protein